LASVIIKSFLIYFALLLTMRLLGKRQLGEMELSEFVVAALMADLAAIPLQDLSIPLYQGLAPVAVLFLCEMGISALSMRSMRLRAFLFGKPSLLITNGVIDQKEMRKNRFTCDELMQELRCQGMTDLSKIEYAILETDGQLNIICRAEESPVTAAQLGIKPPEGGYPLVVISDGRTLTQNLEHLGKDPLWLKRELSSRHIKSAGEVFLMTADSAGNIYIAEKEITSR